jgi:hypothetical protein
MQSSAVHVAYWCSMHVSLLVYTCFQCIYLLCFLRHEDGMSMNDLMHMLGLPACHVMCGPVLQVTCSRCLPCELHDSLRVVLY